MRVKLNRRASRKGGKEYVTYFITLPKDIVEVLSLAEAEEVEVEVRTVEGETAIVIKKPKPPKGSRNDGVGCG